MKIASWNVNSVRVRLPRLLSWLSEHQPDILCLQETKVTDDLFPEAMIREAGYHCCFRGQKTYNGVAILSKRPAQMVQYDFPDNPLPGEARFLDTQWDDLRVMNLYVPNGRDVEHPAYAQKLAWLHALCRHRGESLPSLPTAVCGDFNIAPDDRDVWDPQLFTDTILCSRPERSILSQLMDTGLSDTLRIHHAESGLFSWWDYRNGAFRRNHGLRLDLILVTSDLATRCDMAGIDRDARKGESPSDHAPVWTVFSE